MKPIFAAQTSSYLAAKHSISPEDIGQMFAQTADTGYRPYEDLNNA
jgi:hypothetical protein